MDMEQEALLLDEGEPPVIASGSTAVEMAYVMPRPLTQSSGPSVYQTTASSPMVTLQEPLSTVVSAPLPEASPVPLFRPYP